MAEALCAAGRRFVKPLRYDGVEAVMPDFVLRDVEPPIYVEVYGMPGLADYERRKEESGPSTDARGWPPWSGMSRCPCPTLDGQASDDVEASTTRAVESVGGESQDGAVCGRPSAQRMTRMGAGMVMRLLWEPLPWWWPTKPAREPGIRGLIAWARTRMDDEMDLDFDRRMRRGATQALVRQAFNDTVAEQDDARRRPEAFAQAWRDRLADYLASDSVEVSGWSQITSAELDHELAWRLYEAISQARAASIAQAVAEPSRLRRIDSKDLDYEFNVVAVAHEQYSLGRIAYSVCEPCATGLLRKISFSVEWQYCGLGTMALRELEARHPGLTWYTTAQYADSRDFYARYRQTSTSPWTDRECPCQHF